MNREPAFFKYMRTIIDRFHGPCHVGCPSGYNLNKFKFLKQVKSQVCEQYNSTLQCVRTASSAMTQCHFMEYIEAFTTRENLRKMERMDRAPTNGVNRLILELKIERDLLDPATA